jgi:hypothetical protein
MAGELIGGFDRLRPSPRLWPTGTAGRTQRGSAEMALWSEAEQPGAKRRVTGDGRPMGDNGNIIPGAAARRRAARLRPSPSLWPTGSSLTTCGVCILPVRPDEARIYEQRMPREQSRSWMKCQAKSPPRFSLLPPVNPFPCSSVCSVCCSRCRPWGAPANGHPLPASAGFRLFHRAS